MKSAFSYSICPPSPGGLFLCHGIQLLLADDQNEAGVEGVGRDGEEQAGLGVDAGERGGEDHRHTYQDARQHDRCALMGGG